MKRLVLSLVAALALTGSAAAQTPPTVKLCFGSPCGSVTSGNPLPVSFSASLGGFVPSLAYTTLTATAASSASTALPTNTGTVAFQNNTATTVSCTLASGSATATASEILVPAGSTVFLGTTGYDHAACINQSGSASNVIVLAGGTGLGTGFGGGSSGGGGLSVLDNSSWTNNVSNFTPNGGVFNDSATPLGSGDQGTVRLNANREMHVTCDTGNTLCAAIQAPIPAGTNLIGKVGIDQTTPGTTNNVTIAPSSASAIGITPVVSASAEGTHALKASAGNLYALTTTIGATTGWVMVFDATSAPADGAVTPKFCRYIKSDGTGGSNSVEFNPPLVMATGVSVAFSSTGCFTKTASATAFFAGQVQ